LSIFDRVIAALFALLVLMLAVIVLAVTAGWVNLLDYFNANLLTLENRLAFGLIALILLLMALRFLLVSLRLVKVEEQQALINSANLGAVSIAMPALESLIVRAARQVSGVREIRPHFKVLAGGVAIRLNITVNPDRNIPELTRSLQEKVHEYIAATAGLEVTEVHVRVKEIYREGLRRVE
jgi:uncharacterized alkaline shock family protein YloU